MRPGLPPLPNCQLQGHAVHVCRRAYSSTLSGLAVAMQAYVDKQGRACCLSLRAVNV